MIILYLTESQDTNFLDISGEVCARWHGLQFYLSLVWFPKRVALESFIFQFTAWWEQSSSEIVKETDSERKMICTDRLNLLGFCISRMWTKPNYPRWCKESEQKGVKMELLEAQKGAVVSLSY